MISGESRKIALRAGGTLCVKLEGVSWMNFDADERALLSAISDAMTAYEHKRTVSTPNGTPASDAVGQPASDTSGAITRVPESSSSS